MKKEEIAKIAAAALPLLGSLVALIAVLIGIFVL